MSYYKKQQMNCKMVGEWMFKDSTQYQEYKDCPIQHYFIISHKLNAEYHITSNKTQYATKAMD